jgi:Holliday junction resolvasome RuvABC ATP-dependent DNA helicase subunit
MEERLVAREAVQEDMDEVSLRPRKLSEYISHTKTSIVII